MLKYELVYGNQEDSYKNLMHIVPSEILIGPNDKIPGLKTTALSARYVPNEPIIFNMRKTIYTLICLSIYAHNIRITSINEIEDSFKPLWSNSDGKQYLRKLCMKSGAQNQATVTAEILERKLTVVPHNTWKQIGQEAMISLNADSKGNI